MTAADARDSLGNRSRIGATSAYLLGALGVAAAEAMPAAARSERL